MCICMSGSKHICCVKWRTYVMLCEVSDKKPHVFQNLKTDQPCSSVYGCYHMQLPCAHPI